VKTDKVDVRGFRRSAKVWLPAWRQFRQAYREYSQRGGDSLPIRSYRRINDYIREIEMAYAALKVGAPLLERRTRFRRDVSDLKQQVDAAGERIDELRSFLDVMRGSIERFEEALYREPAEG